MTTGRCGHVHDADGVDPSQTPVDWQIQVFLKSLYFSVVTFATLGYGDIQPIGG